MIKLKTSIKCNACVETVKPYLNELPLKSWKVDLTDPDRILTVEGEVPVETVQAALEKAGYNSSPI